MKGLLLELAGGTVGTEVGTERSRQVGVDSTNKHIPELRLIYFPLVVVIISSTRHYLMEAREQFAAIYGSIVVMLGNEIHHEITKTLKEVAKA